MVSIRLDGDVGVLTRRLRKMTTVNMGDVTAVMAEQLRSSTIQRFKTQRGPDGRTWLPSQRALLSNGSTLSDKGRLRRSIRAKSDNSGLAVGTNVIYARRHQEGDARPMTIRAKSSKGLRFRVGGRWVTKQSVKVQLPARPFLGIDRDDLAEIQSILEEYVVGGGDG